jgi:Holliday junction resolvase RusA-like endonuclease
MYTSGVAKNYAKDFCKQIMEHHRLLADYDGGLVVSMVIYAVSKRQDLDSYSKILLDSMQAARIIKNDNRVDELYLRRFIDKANPRVEIKLWASQKLSVSQSS